MTTDQPPTRRERLRAETIREITTIALAQMAEGGPGAISLRGIAREMGMTARAIYSYFPTRDDLVTALIGGLSESLAGALESARDAVPASEPGNRLLAWGEALRAWAVANPAGFRLVYGDPVPGYQPPPGGPAEQAARRICAGLNQLVAEVGRPRAADQVDWSAFPPGYAAKVRADVPEVSPAVVSLALRVWGRLHGLVTLEVFGHLGSVSADPAALYRADLLDLLDSVGADVPR
ncbi:TetR/AcrR family transcriptional regulator [Crossiella sp. CA-258035]|uniref:TetR/AcrR family transcriptional regulator n=1 Tax=Crossiella sp. CA-258035 TaxID=2981138 RepID=UPI0024BD03B0|nr:TetR/AcrR family transcriptional regulator [Crossiella sp. CA-258035]WHT23634.1 TetR/AcrR family transcriptional regulator [Crossiella sp. CA-258035]